MGNTSKIFGFIHVATIGRWQQVFDEQIKALFRSELYKKTDSIFVSKLGKGEMELNEKFHLAFSHDSLEFFEFPSLYTAYSHAKFHSGLSWYIHLKGVSKTQEDFNQNRESYERSTGHKSFYGLSRAERMWRKYMEYFVIYKHEECIAALEDYDICGVHWRDDPLPHFAGNFWWATNSYLRTLEDPYEFWKQASDYPSSASRLMAEFWVGSGNPRTKVLWNNDYKLHHMAIQPYEYRKIRIF